MNGYLWLSNSRKYRSSRTSMLDGWSMAGVVGLEGHAARLELGPDVTVGEQHGATVVRSAAVRQVRVVDQQRHLRAVLQPELEQDARHVRLHGGHARGTARGRCRRCSRRARSPTTTSRSRSVSTSSAPARAARLPPARAVVSMSRRATRGDSTGSPAAAASTASTIRSRLGVLEQVAARAGVHRGLDLVGGVERGEHDDGGRVRPSRGPPGSPRCRRCPASAGP